LLVEIKKEKKKDRKPKGKEKKSGSKVAKPIKKKKTAKPKAVKPKPLKPKAAKPKPEKAPPAPAANSSMSVTAQVAISAIRALESSDAISAYIKGDERVTVKKAGLAKITRLSKQ